MAMEQAKTSEVSLKKTWLKLPFRNISNLMKTMSIGHVRDYSLDSNEE